MHKGAAATSQKDTEDCKDTSETFRTHPPGHDGSEAGPDRQGPLCCEGLRCSCEGGRGARGHRVWGQRAQKVATDVVVHPPVHTCAASTGLMCKHWALGMQLLDMHSHGQMGSLSKQSAKHAGRLDNGSDLCWPAPVRLQSAGLKRSSIQQVTSRTTCSSLHRSSAQRSDSVMPPDPHDC